MAHLREIITVCARCSTAPACVELFNIYNAPVGKYCKRCGKLMLAQQREAEAALMQQPTR